MDPENAFDPSLLDNEDVRKAAIEKLSGSGFVVKPKDQFDASMNDFIKGLSHEDDRVSHLVAPVVRREREAVENLAKEFFPDAQKLVIDGKTESHLDFLKRNLSGKISELSDKAKKGVTDADLIKNFDDYKSTSSAKYKKAEQQINELNAKLLQKDIIFEVDKSIAKREGKFSNDERLKPLIQTHVDSAKRQAMEMKPEYRQIGESKVLVFIDENGSIKYKEGDPYTVDRYIDETLAPIMEQERNLGGTGTGADKDKGNSGFVVPANIKNKIELDEYISSELKLSLKDPEVLKKRKEIIDARKLSLK